jgi:hypothetical protein
LFFLLISFSWRIEQEQENAARKSSISVVNDKQTIKHFIPFLSLSLSLLPFLLALGIPVHAILFAYMGDFFGKTVSRCAMVEKSRAE